MLELPVYPFADCATALSATQLSSEAYLGMLYLLLAIYFMEVLPETKGLEAAQPHFFFLRPSYWKNRSRPEPRPDVQVRWCFCSGTIKLDGFSENCRETHRFSMRPSRAADVLIYTTESANRSALVFLSL